jgi:hypothetical protein
MSKQTILKNVQETSRLNTAPNSHRDSPLPSPWGGNIIETTVVLLHLEVISTRTRETTRARRWVTRDTMHQTRQHQTIRQHNTTQQIS